jgi:NADH-quinone oxidoreductase subunit E
MEAAMEKRQQALPVGDPLANPAQRAIINEVVTANAARPGANMVVLNELQSRIGHISPPMQAYVARRLKVPVSTIHGVVSFYSFFTTRPRGRHTVKLCMGTACYVGGTPQLIDKAKQVLGINPGETTADGALTLELCRCVGACSQAPVLTVDDEVFGRLRPNKLPQLLRRYQSDGQPARESE